MKTIIVLYAREKKGKSKTLRELAYLYKKAFSKLIKFIEPNTGELFESGDFNFIFKIKSKIFAIISQGDPNTGILQRLNEIKYNYDCNLIYCATRTRGQTVWDVDTFAKENNYKVIWTSPYQTNLNNEKINKLKAKHLLDLGENINESKIDVNNGCS